MAVDRARMSMDEELYRKRDEDVGRIMIFKMTRDRTEDGRGAKRGVVIKDNTGGSSQKVRVLRIWAANFKERRTETEQQVASISQARLGDRRKWRILDRKKWKRQCTI